MEELVVKRVLLIISGTLAVGLGVIGIFLPIFPQTPFFILAAFCYVRSSERLYNWLISTKFFGENFKNYMEYKAISKKAKTTMFFTIWVSITISFIVFDLIYLRISLIVMGLIMSLVVNRIKTMEEEPSPDDEQIN